MPTLTRLFFIAILFCLLIYGGMWGLVLWVKPVTVELSVEIPSSAVEFRPWPYE